MAGFGIKELLATLIVVVVGMALTFIIGWMISAIITPIFAFFLFKLVSLQAKDKSYKIDVEGNCGYCGRKLKWIPEHSRYYCYQCGKYPPTCPQCRRDLFWIPEYSRFYCNTCQRYIENREKTEKFDVKMEKTKRSTRSKKENYYPN